MIPLLIELRPKTPLVPTLYMLWNNPDLLPQIYTVPYTSHYLINGADLLWPGVVYREQVHTER